MKSPDADGVVHANPVVPGGLGGVADPDQVVEPLRCRSADKHAESMTPLEVPVPDGGHPLAVERVAAHGVQLLQVEMIDAVADLLIAREANTHRAVRQLRVGEQVRGRLHDDRNAGLVIRAGADTPLGLQYIAPYAGCAIAESFFDRGIDTLVIYDDLTRHAEAYRSLSLSGRRRAKSRPRSSSRE